jgi:seryl-tRNA synthetase
MNARRCTLELPRRIDDDLAAELEKQSAWISSRVRDMRVGVDRRVVRFSIEDGADIDTESAKVTRFLADMTERHRELPRKIVAGRSRQGRAIAPDAFAELVRRRWVVETARGRVALRGPALAVVKALDDDCARIARGTFGAADEAHPALAATSLLARCRWFGSFPQAASLVAHLNEDYDAIDAFRRDNAEARDLVQPAPGTLASIDACLLPALCYSVYAGREGSTLFPGVTAVTCAGRCFRYESRNFAGLERLWEFGMREVVFLGEQDAVARSRQMGLESVLAQLERWDLEGTLETASDPFFPAVRSRNAHWQRNNDRKIELRLPVAQGDGEVKAIACASLNLHDSFFGTTFAIATSDGMPAATACVGWGMERWMLACFAQHGFDAEGWPEWLRDRVFG